MGRPTAPIESMSPTVTPTDAPESPSQAPTLTCGTSPMPTGSAGAVPTFRRLGDYELLSEIARGGMGVVYKARHVSLGRVVALKMILASRLASEEALRRFRVEAEAAARLDHSGIVPIYEVGEEDGQQFFSMALVDGGNLATLAHEGPLLPRRAAELTRTIAEAVQFAHARNIVHRDLKPANVLLDRDGRPKVTDFGLARNLDADSNATESGQILGTPSFMAPEQAAGRTSEVGPLADVYALGAILYFLLTGRPPFHGESVVETLQQVVSQEPLPPGRLNPRADLDVSTICLKCLEKNPATRYASAGQLAEELDRYLSGEPILARPVGRGERLWRWARRYPARAGAMLATFIAIVATVGAGVAFYYQDQLQGANSQLASLNGGLTVANAHLETAKGQLEESHKTLESTNQNLVSALAGVAKAKADLDSVVSLHRMTAALAAYRENDVGLARDLLAECPAENRGWEWRYLDRLCRPEIRILASPEHRFLEGVRFSSDGRQVACVARPGITMIWDVESGRLLDTVRDAEKSTHARPGHFPDKGWVVGLAPNALTFDGKGRQFRHALKVDAVPSCETLWKANAPTRGVGHAITFSPDMSRVALGFHTGHVAVYNARDGALVSTFPLLAKAIICLAFSSDGTKIAGGSTDKFVRVRDIDGEKTLHQFDFDAVSCVGVAYSPDGTRLAGGLHDGRVMVWNLQEGGEPLTLSAKEGSRCLAFSPDGRRIAAAGNDRIVRVWEAVTGQPAAILKGHTATITDLAYSPDGERLVTCSGDRSVRIWPANRDPESQTIEPDNRAGLKLPPRSVDFSPDGRHVLCCGKNGSLSLIGLRDHQRDPESSWTRDGNPDGNTLRLGAMAAGGRRVVSLDHVITSQLLTDHTLTLRDSETGDEIQSIRGDASTGPLDFFAVHPDGRRILAGFEQGLWKELDAEDGRELASAYREGASEVTLAVWLPNGERVTTSWREFIIRVWDAQGRRELRQLKGHTSIINNITSSADGRWILSSGTDGTVRIWDPAAGTLMQTLRGHIGVVFDAAFSPDGRCVASGGGDGTIRLWDAQRGLRTLVLNVHADGVRSVAFSPDGHQIVSLESSGQIRLWNAAPRVNAVTTE